MNNEKLKNCPFESGAFENLKQYQGQLDEDGVCVAVSRQALDEVLAYTETTRAQLDEAMRVIEDGVFNAKCVISNMEEMSPYGFSTTEEEEWIKAAQAFIKRVRG